MQPSTSNTEIPTYRKHSPFACTPQLFLFQLATSVSPLKFSVDGWPVGISVRGRKTYQRWFKKSIIFRGHEKLSLISFTTYLYRQFFTKHPSLNVSPSGQKQLLLLLYYCNQVNISVIAYIIRSLSGRHPYFLLQISKKT